MRILFDNDRSIELEINNTPLGLTYQAIYKHLQWANLSFFKWDNPFYTDNLSYGELVDQLILHANRVGVEVDPALCLQKNQQYFNDIHMIFEQRYNGEPGWMEFHECIHVCENYPKKPAYLTIDYREKSGLLEKKIESQWLENSTNNIKKGDIFIQWAELGKTPYLYWKHNEPSDIARICQLAKPWRILRPSLLIAVDDIDTLANKETTEFADWWQQYSYTWCKHWELSRWDITDMHSAVVFGRVADIDTLITNLKNNILPTGIQL